MHSQEDPKEFKRRNAKGKRVRTVEQKLQDQKETYRAKTLLGSSVEATAAASIANNQKPSVEKLGKLFRTCMIKIS